MVIEYRQVARDAAAATAARRPSTPDHRLKTGPHLLRPVAGSLTSSPRGIVMTFGVQRSRSADADRRVFCRHHGSGRRRSLNAVVMMAAPKRRHSPLELRRTLTEPGTWALGGRCRGQRTSRIRLVDRRRRARPAASVSGRGLSVCTSQLAWTRRISNEILDEQPFTWCRLLICRRAVLCRHFYRRSHP